MPLTTELAPSKQTFALFEASSIKQFIIEQLNAGGIFIDQKYLGSNLNCFIDIIAVMLQQLQFYYNTTATESTFATATLYENMNKLVSLFNYKPTGYQTSILPVDIQCTLNTINKSGTFIVPRYSFINYNKSYILRSDLAISVYDKAVNVNDIMYQGTVTESETMALTGEDFQVFTLIDTYVRENSGRFISDNFFDVYVKEPGGRWSQYKEVDTLYEYDGTAKVVERRLNEHYNYEFKFGNNINGYKPVESSEVVIFYLVSDGSLGEVGDNLINDADIFLYNSPKFNEIIMDQVSGIFEFLPAFITSADLSHFSISNTGHSTAVTEAETVDLIRNNTAKLFVAQNRLLTEQDYTTFINKTFSNFIRDNYVFNNKEYTGDYLRYFYDIGLKAPNEDSRLLLNQVLFQTSCGFNNIYITLLPLINTIINGKVPNYVNENLKQYIVEQMVSRKDMVHNIAPIDPIYKAVSFGINRADSKNLAATFDDVKLVLVRDKYSNFSSEYISSQAVSIFTDFFNSALLGTTIDVTAISGALLKIPGVKYIKMSDGENEDTKLTLIVWNPLYEENDFTITQQNIILSPFMYPYFFDLDNINSKISVINE